jgi:hypothetical protein
MANRPLPEYLRLGPEILTTFFEAGITLDEMAEHTIGRSANWLRAGRRRSAIAFLDKLRCILGLHYYVSGRGAGSELYIAAHPLDATNYRELGAAIHPVK